MRFCAVSAQLGEVDDVNGRAFFGDEFLDRVFERHVVVLEFERHGAFVGFDGGGFAAVQAGEFLFEEGGVAKGGGHEEETGL
jgi:hypothetical protein